MAASALRQTDVGAGRCGCSYRCGCTRNRVRPAPKTGSGPCAGSDSGVSARTGSASSPSASASAGATSRTRTRRAARTWRYSTTSLLLASREIQSSSRTDATRETRKRELRRSRECCAELRLPLRGTALVAPTPTGDSLNVNVRRNAGVRGNCPNG